jgi:hypothetical protein
MPATAVYHSENVCQRHEAHSEVRSLSTLAATQRIEFSSVAIPIWREAFLGLDWVALRASRVYRGHGIPTATARP